MDLEAKRGRWQNHPWVPGWLCKATLSFTLPCPAFPILDIPEQGVYFFVFSQDCDGNDLSLTDEELDPIYLYHGLLISLSSAQIENMPLTHASHTLLLDTLLEISTLRKR